MGHLYTVRTRWEAERLAHYLLSRFSFVAQPTTIADDVGSDFYCAILGILYTSHRHHRSDDGSRPTECTGVGPWAALAVRARIASRSPG